MQMVVLGIYPNTELEFRERIFSVEGKVELAIIMPTMYLHTADYHGRNLGSNV